MDDIPVLDHIRLSFLPELSSRFNGSQRLPALAKVVEILVGDDFSFDEAALEVAMDDASSLRCKSASLDDPAANLFFSGFKLLEPTFEASQRTKRTGEIVL